MGDEMVTSMNWEQLTDLAVRDTDEGWGKIDEQLSQVCTDQAVIKGAVNGLLNSNEHIQDLSASVFGVQETDFFKNLARTNTQLLSRLRLNVKEGVGPYAQFRAAAALGEHGYSSLEVIEKLREFENDPDVGDISKRLLAKYQ